MVVVWPASQSVHWDHARLFFFSEKAFFSKVDAFLKVSFSFPAGYLWNLFPTFFLCASSEITRQEICAQ